MKKRVITVTIALLALAMLSGIATADQKKGEGKGKTCRSAKRFHGPFGGLKLTAEQRKKIQAIMKDAHEKIKKEVLTKEQREKLGKKCEEMKKRMAKHGPFGGLDLSDEQEKKIRGIMKEAHAKTKKADSREEKRKIMKAAFEEVKNDVLTVNQCKKLEEMKKHRKHRRGPFAGLDLTDKQKKKIKDIMDEAHAKAKKADSREEKREIMKAAFEEVKNDVLTDEQQKKCEERMKKHKERPRTSWRKRRKEKDDDED